jgi:DNA-binding MarR family transcriptional regulator
MSSIYGYHGSVIAEDPRFPWIPAWLQLVRTHSALWSLIEEDMRQHHGLTMARYDVLAHLNMAGGRLGLTELAGAIALSPSGLSKLLDRMEASELIERQADPDDARSSFAVITRRGRSVVTAARARHHEFLNGLVGEALSDRDLGDLIRVMQKLAASAARAATAASRTRARG